MRKSYFTLLFVSLFIYSNAQTELSSYSFEERTENFVSISSTGTLITLTDLANDDDDGNYILDLSSQNISFPFCGENFNQFSINVNGAIMLGNATFESRYNDLDNDLEQDLSKIIAPLWDDLTFIDYNDEGIYYQVDGDTITIEWNNITQYYHKYKDARVTFQVKLNTQNGTIQLVYGDMSPAYNGSNSWNGDLTASIGINNFENSETVYQSVAPGDPSVVYADFDTIIGISNAPYLLEGTVYEFTTTIPTSANTISTSTLSMYPNPSTGIIYVDGIKDNCYVDVCDVTGKLVSNKNLSKMDNSINLSNMNKGIYFVKVHNSNSISTHKIIIR